MKRETSSVGPTLALVGGAVRVRQVAARLPRSVVVERQTFLTRVAGGVVLAYAHQTAAVTRRRALSAVQVAPASASMHHQQHDAADIHTAQIVTHHYAQQHDFH